MTNDFSLAGKRYCVTGGTRGIGRSISLHFARAGADVIANYVRNEKAANAFAAETEHEKLAVTLCKGDLTGEKGLQRLLSCIDRNKAPLDGIIFCAATGVHKDIPHLDSRAFDWTFSLNVRAFFNCVKLLRDRLNDNACIIPISSKGARRAVPYYSLVGASKGALESFSRHLAVELAPMGIRVNIIVPGSVENDSWKVLPDKEKRLADTVARTPLGRLVTGEDVARAAHFLCSDASLGIIGHTLVVDGGNEILE